MKIKRIQVLIFSIFLLIPIFGYSNNSAIELSKTITNDYKVKEGVSLDITSKYGQIILNTWKRDSVLIKIVVTAKGKNKEVAQRLLDRTDFIVDYEDNHIKAKTVIDQSRSFKDMWSSSKLVLNRDQLRIQFQIYLPSYANIDLTNKFGDVYIEDTKGKVKVGISNGNLKTDHLSGETDINLSFGEANIRSLNVANLSLKSAEVEITAANEISLESSSSEISIDQVNLLTINSRTDKIEIKELESLQGQSSFTKISVKEFKNATQIDMNYGTLNINQAVTGFEKLIAVGKSTDINIYFDHDAYISTKLETKVGKLDLPLNHDLKQTYTDGREKYIHSSGYLGTKNSTPSDVIINAQGGNVKLRFLLINPKAKR